MTDRQAVAEERAELGRAHLAAGNAALAVSELVTAHAEMPTNPVLSPDLGLELVWLARAYSLNGQHRESRDDRKSVV